MMAPCLSRFESLCYKLLLWGYIGFGFPVWLVLLPLYVYFRAKREVTPQDQQAFYQAFAQRMKMTRKTEASWLKSADTPAVRQTVIWFHAVSVGEVVALYPFVLDTLRHYPHCRAYLTVSTWRAMQWLRNQTLSTMFQERLRFEMAPVDLPWLVSARLKCYEPSVLVLMEGERWPCMTWLAMGAGVRVIQMNARIAPKSLKHLQKWPIFLRQWLCVAPFDVVASQSAQDTQRLRSLLTPKFHACIQTVGQLKYAYPANPQPVLVHQLQRWLGLTSQDKTDIPCWVVGSLHPQELPTVLEAWQVILKLSPLAKAVWVPRHPEKIAQFTECLTQAGIPWVRRSTCDDTTTDALPQGGVFLMDTIGELHSAYALATAAWVGGSFHASLGGHNPLEPLSLGVPTACGPYTPTFESVVETLVTHQALEVLPLSCAEVQYQAWWQRVTHPDKRQICIKNAQKAMAAYQDVAATYLNLLLPSS
jgi:3-deoxy-D-manno-octulosonic-acid transferase